MLFTLSPLPVSVLKLSRCSCVFVAGGKSWTRPTVNNFPRSRLLALYKSRLRSRRHVDECAVPQGYISQAWRDNSLENIIRAISPYLSRICWLPYPRHLSVHFRLRLHNCTKVPLIFSYVLCYAAFVARCKLPNSSSLSCSVAEMHTRQFLTIHFLWNLLYNMFSATLYPSAEFFH